MTTPLQSAFVIPPLSKGDAICRLIISSVVATAVWVGMYFLVSEVVSESYDKRLEAAVVAASYAAFLAFLFAHAAGTSGHCDTVALERQELYERNWLQSGPHPPTHRNREPFRPTPIETSNVAFIWMAGAWLGAFLPFMYLINETYDYRLVVSLVVATLVALFIGGCRVLIEEQLPRASQDIEKRRHYEEIWLNDRVEDGFTPRQALWLLRQRGKCVRESTIHERIVREVKSR